jgi:PTS system nitrogen regulatory IIA component
MEYLDYLSEDLVVLLKAHRKTEVILEMAQLAADRGLVPEADHLAEKLFYREQLMSTGLGLGIGIPHVRYERLSRPVVAVGLQPAGIDGYESLDGKPVKIVVMILVGPEEHKLHVRLLSQIVQMLKDEATKERLLGSKDAGEAWKILSGARDA